MTQNNHSCPAVVVHCMDWRFRIFLNHWLEERFPEGWDTIALAGAVKPLIEDGAIDNMELKQLQLADKLHAPGKIVLIQHEDCGAYGGSVAFSGPEAEREYQRGQLKIAVELLQEYFPAARIETHFIHLDGTIETFELR
jgi:carbonic anhydrase